MTDAGTERRKNVRLALALSAGLHLLALSTVDLAPGSWRHGLRPALQVTLVPASAEAAEDAPTRAARPAAPSKPVKPEGEQGLSTRRAQSGQAYVSKLRGMVKARVYIDEEGKVVSVQIVQAKPRGGIFEEAAQEALRQLRYSPALIAGQAVKTQKLVQVEFNPYEAEEKARE